jgi:hypothetical protein
MVIRTFFNKNNTIVKNSIVNTGLNPVTELFYGGADGSEKYSRFLFNFDETRLRDLYTGGTYTDLTKLKHTLRLTNTASFDKGLLNGTMQAKDRASSFDLILFKIGQEWDNGVGYDYEVPILLNGDYFYSTEPSNWTAPTIGGSWTGGTGVYSGSPSGITVTTQHFDKGNENIEMDITNYVNSVITGNTNYGLGIAYARGYELLNTNNLKYIGFFTNNTQTFYEPYIETIYNYHIKDDRNDFFLDKHNKLYLYVNLGGNPTNLDSIPNVDVYDNSGIIFSSYTSSDVEHVSLGVYSIDIIVPTNGSNENTMYSDVWKNVVIKGVTRPNISLDVVMKPSTEYYNIGNNDMLPKKIAVSVSGIRNQEKIKRGDIRKGIVSARIPYTVEQTQKIDNLQYRLYVREGVRELTVIDFQPVEMANNYYYFLLDTASFIPNTYYLDILATSNLEVTTIKNVVQFDIVNQVELRKGQ